MMKEINITTRQQLDIYMNPQRQKLLKCMGMHPEPMTPKKLSTLLNISPSSVTFHLKKLEEIGLVTIDHTEMIHGICARFYIKVPAVVNLQGNVHDDLQEEKEVLAEYMLKDTWNGFMEYMKSQTPSKNSLSADSPFSADSTASADSPAVADNSSAALSGDAINGILYLTNEEAAELMQLIQKFHANHTQPKGDAKPWDVCLIAYPTK